MDDFSQYFNALQEASFANQIANLKNQQDEEQRQAIAPIGELISTEGIKEGISSTIDSVKEMALNKAKDVATQAMKKAGVDDETIQSVLISPENAIRNIKEAIQSKAQSLIGQVKGKAEDVISQAKEAAENAVSQAKATAEDALSQAKGVVQTVQNSGVDLSSIKSPLDGATNTLTDDNASSMADLYFSRFGNEFEEAGDTLEGTRPLFGSLRPPQIDIPTMDGTPLSDLAGQLVPADLGTAGEDAIATAKTFIPDIADTITSQVSNLVAPATDALSGIAGTADDAVSSLSNLASTASTAVSGATDAILSGASVAADTAEAATGIASIGADVALGPLGILVGLGAGIASLVESLKKPHEAAPVNAAAQFL
jgi:ElaB/YqjD/DUF883 family membrane-anchored ribosome-binding protein